MKNPIKFDIVIPLKSTNSSIIDNITLLSNNNHVNRIIIGDAGLNELIKLALSKLEKVEIFDQKNIYSLGFCIIDLIKKVGTEYFVYLHGDVTLPENWFEVMYSNMDSYEFAECARQYHYKIDTLDTQINLRSQHDRPLSGSQMGNTKFIIHATSSIEDDHLFRNEDIIIPDLVRKSGGKYGFINETYHTHQIGFSRVNEHIRATETISVVKKPTINDVQLFIHQICGIVKYTIPDSPYHIWNFDYSMTVLKKYSADLTQVNRELSLNRRWLLIYKLTWLRMLRRKISKIFRIMKMSDLEILEL